MMYFLRPMSEPLLPLPISAPHEMGSNILHRKFFPSFLRRRDDVRTLFFAKHFFYSSFFLTFSFFLSFLCQTFFYPSFFFNFSFSSFSSPNIFFIRLSFFLIFFLFPSFMCGFVFPLTFLRWINASSAMSND